LAVCEERTGGQVEIEFAVTFGPDPPPTGRLGFLQVRPMAVADAVVEVSEDDVAAQDALVTSRRVLGNGSRDVHDVVYVRSFDPSATREVAAELEKLDRSLRAGGRPYLLIGFGRWGTTDPRAGVPVAWGQIAGACAIVEAPLPGVGSEPSQGSHFFHNVTSFRVFYFTAERHEIRWEWLDAQPAASETSRVRHVKVEVPLRLAVDGRSGRGVVRLGRRAEPTSSHAPAQPAMDAGREGGRSR
jgi:hypothetical protein